MINYESAAVSKFGANIESWKNKNIEGFYTKTTQKGGLSKIQQNQSIHR
jgi:hypothetical protein